MNLGPKGNFFVNWDTISEQWKKIFLLKNTVKNVLKLKLTYSCCLKQNNNADSDPTEEIRFGEGSRPAILLINNNRDWHVGINLPKTTGGYKPIPVPSYTGHWTNSYSTTYYTHTNHTREINIILAMNICQLRHYPNIKCSGLEPINGEFLFLFFKVTVSIDK